MPLFDDWCENDEEEDKKKRLWKLTEKDDGRAAIVEDLAETVRSHYNSLERIADDVEELGYEDASAILRERLPRGKKARSGDLGRNSRIGANRRDDSASVCRSGVCNSKTGAKSHCVGTTSSASPTTRNKIACVF